MDDQHTLSNSERCHSLGDTKEKHCTSPNSKAKAFHGNHYVSTFLSPSVSLRPWPKINEVGAISEYSHSIDPELKSI